VARHGRVWHDKDFMVSHGGVWSGEERFGKGITAGYGKVIFSEVWWCMVWRGKGFMAWPGAVGFGAVR